MRLVTIKGTEDQLTAAKQLIQAKVEEEDAMRRKIDLSASNRAPRHKHKPGDAGKTQVRAAETAHLSDICISFNLLWNVSVVKAI